MDRIAHREEGDIMRGRRPLYSQLLARRERWARARAGRRRPRPRHVPGQVATEYALLLLVIATVVSVAFHILSPAVIATMHTVAHSL